MEGRKALGRERGVPPLSVGKARNRPAAVCEGSQIGPPTVERPCAADLSRSECLDRTRRRGEANGSHDRVPICRLNFYGNRGLLVLFSIRGVLCYNRPPLFCVVLGPFHQRTSFRVLVAFGLILLAVLS